MRSTRWARWATCALALFVCVPAFAKRRAKSLADCATFTQTEKDDATLELAIANRCKVPVDCSIKWRVVCAPGAPKRRAVHAKEKTFELAEGDNGTAEASAAICGDDSYTIDSIRWGCEPDKD